MPTNVRLARRPVARQPVVQHSKPSTECQDRPGASDQHIEKQDTNNRTWSAAHGIAFEPTRRNAASVASSDVLDKPDDRGDTAKPQAQSIGDESIFDEELRSEDEPKSDDDDGTAVDYVPLTYQIPEAKMSEALQAANGSMASYWSYDKYKTAEGESVTLHYCRTKDASEKVAKLFLESSALGCDIEWKANAKENDGIKSNVSLLQLATEDRIGLFHIALHKGDTADELLAPTLKQILESPDILKCGVSIRGDFTRMQKHLGVEPVALFELSHLYKLVEYGTTKRHLVNKRLVSLAAQTKVLLGLPLYKGDERVSDWSQALNMEQCKYAADDAYASYRVFEALNEKWHALDPRPPFPAWAELNIPIKLAPLPESESSDDSADSETEALRSQIKELVMKRDGDDSGSEDSYGSNVFDSLTEDQMQALEHAHDSGVQLNDPAVSYPSLASEIDIAETKTFSPGRLGLQPRLRASSGRQQRPTPQSPFPTDASLDSEQESESDEDFEEMKTDLRLVNSANKELLLEATEWAELNKVWTRYPLNIAALRAYYLWEHKEMQLPTIAAVLRETPLKTATVAAYIAECIQFGDKPFSDRNRLQDVAIQLPRQARDRYWRIRKMTRVG